MNNASTNKRARKGDRARTGGVGKRLIRGLTEIRDALETGRPLEERFTVRTVRAPDTPSDYTPEDVKRLREKQLGVSQAVFAQLLGVSSALVRAWEAKRQRRVPPPIARRLFDQIRRDPTPWLEMVQPRKRAEAGAA